MKTNELTSSKLLIPIPLLQPQQRWEAPFTQTNPNCNCLNALKRYLQQPTHHYQEETIVTHTKSNRRKMFTFNTTLTPHFKKKKES